MFRKSDEKTPTTSVYQFSVQKVIDFYKKTYNLTVDEMSIRHRFYHIIDESKNEGFFAKKIILIEGDTEKYALPNYFSAKGLDIDVSRIAIISAGSVDNIAYLLLIFNEFRIPCYAIFDGDKPDVDPNTLAGSYRDDAVNKSKRNKELFTFLNKPVPTNLFFFPATSIEDNLTVWEKSFEDEFHKPLANYVALKSEAKKLYGNDSKPLTARFISEKVCADPAKIDNKIDLIIAKLKALTCTKSITE